MMEFSRSSIYEIVQPRTRLQLTKIITVLLVVASPLLASTHRHAVQQLLWHDPGDVARLDLVNGPGGKVYRPAPPFRFITEDLSGTSAKIKVKDRHGRTWSVKFGPEARPSVFSSHLVWACGYNVETEYFVPRGEISGAHGLKRAQAYIDSEGSFKDARFQLRNAEPVFLKEVNWSWTYNPFLNTRQFNGLRILMMLLSNWDAKDARDLDADSHNKGADSNLAIFESHTPGRKYIYFVSDWGASMGRYSAVMGRRDKWDSKAYLAQTTDFVRGVRNGQIVWGFSGKHGDDIKTGIGVDDVRWLLKYLGRITDAQIRGALGASDIPERDASLFADALRERINELRQVARPSNQ